MNKLNSTEAEAERSNGSGTALKEHEKSAQKGSVTFKTTVLATGGNTTGIEVPKEVVASLGPQKRPPVKVSFSGYSYQSRIGVMGGKSLIPLSAAHREASGAKAGDKLQVTVELDSTR
jgi:hypothetical protein